MFNPLFHTGDDYYDIEVAIRNGHAAYARERLRELIADTTDAEVWYLAALVALNPQEHIHLLEKALALNPNHDRALRALELAEQNNATVSSTSHYRKPGTKQHKAKPRNHAKNK